MKRLSFVLLTSFLLACLSGSVWADAGFWAGTKVIYFNPPNIVVEKTCNSFWGGGIDIGWIARKHIETSLQGSYLRTKSEDYMAVDPSGNIVGNYWFGLSEYKLTPRVAWRFLMRHTPYLGFGVGFHRSTWAFGGVELYWISEESKRQSASTVCSEVFAGYDFRMVKKGGIRAEGVLQFAHEKDDRGFFSNPDYQDMSGWKASLGAYVAW